MEKYYVTTDPKRGVRWYSDPACKILHRRDGPAQETMVRGKIVYQAWVVDGKLHRTDGPAIRYLCRHSFWYLDGVKVSKTEHALRTRSAQEMTLAEIEVALGKSIKIIS